MAGRPLTDAAQALHGGWHLEATLTALGEGHINDTLLAVTDRQERFVLQRLSRAVFADPERVMTNLVRVIDHLQRLGETRIPTLVPTASAGWAFVDAGGDWWRLWRYLAGGRSLSRSTDPAICRAAGEAFGRFQRLLADLPGPTLEPTIPGFLELDGYLARFDAVSGTAEAADALVAACKGAPIDDPMTFSDALRFIDARRALAGRFPRQQDVIHGDCKLNNLLFAADAPQVIAVLDLDTVMVGHWAWDLGDLTRSVLLGAASTAVARTALAALCAGFAAGSGRGVDVGTALDAAGHVAFMLGIRFLTDHLEGDRYFRVARRGMNLDRAREQFALVRRLAAERGSLASPVAGGR